MTTVTEADIKELKELLVKQGEQLNNIDKRLAVIQARLDEWKPMIQKIPDLAKKSRGIKKLEAIDCNFCYCFNWYFSPMVD